MLTTALTMPESRVAIRSLRPPIGQRRREDNGLERPTSVARNVASADEEEGCASGLRLRCACRNLFQRCAISCNVPITAEAGAAGGGGNRRQILLLTAWPGEALLMRRQGKRLCGEQRADHRHQRRRFSGRAPLSIMVSP